MVQLGGVHIACSRWLFWDRKYDTNTYRWVRQREGGGVAVQGLPRVEHPEKEATHRESHKVPRKEPKGTLQAGGLGVGGLGSKCATGTLQTGRWQHKEGSKWLQSKVFTQKKTDLMVGPKVAESGGKEETPR